METTDISLDGSTFLRARLEVLARIVEAGQQALVVFDLDNTVFDTRPRTLLAARSFDAREGSAWFAGLGLDDMRRDGHTLAASRGLPPALVERFAEHWRETFWDPSSFALDLPLAPIVDWIHAALEVGVGVRYLTGRITRYHDASLAELARAGLPTAPAAVVCKPAVGLRTGSYKAAALAAWRAEATIGWFMTEGCRDIAAIQAEVPDLPCVLIDCSFEEPIAEVVARTPRLPRCF